MYKRTTKKWNTYRLCLKDTIEVLNIAKNKIKELDVHIEDTKIRLDAERVVSLLSGFITDVQDTLDAEQEKS